MTDDFAHRSDRRGIHRAVWNRIKFLRNKTFQAPFGVDDPDKCWLGRDYWHNHPVQDFDYKFNSWGCRGVDYEQFLKEKTDQKVNICIGDSHTLNLGGPQEHSWPHLLELKSGIPSINLANDGMSSYYFRELINKTKDLVNTNHVFILYNVLDEAGMVLSADDPSEDESTFSQKLKFLKEHCWVPDAYWQFNPPSVFSKKNQQILYQHLPTAHDFVKNARIDLRNVNLELLLMCHPVRQKYNQLSGTDWLSYDEFCKLYLQQVNVLELFRKSIDKKLIQEFLIGHLNIAIKFILFGSRDGLHMNKQTNQLLADYFYQQSLTIKPLLY
jgi:hypothetical protein